MVSLFSEHFFTDFFECFQNGVVWSADGGAAEPVGESSGFLLTWQDRHPTQHQPAKEPPSFVLTAVWRLPECIARLGLHLGQAGLPPQDQPLIMPALPIEYLEAVEVSSKRAEAVLARAIRSIGREPTFGVTVRPVLPAEAASDRPPQGESDPKPLLPHFSEWPMRVRAARMLALGLVQYRRIDQGQTTNFDSSALATATLLLGNDAFERGSERLLKATSKIQMEFAEEAHRQGHRVDLGSTRHEDEISLFDLLDFWQQVSAEGSSQGVSGKPDGPGLDSRLLIRTALAEITRRPVAVKEAATRLAEIFDLWAAQDPEEESFQRLISNARAALKGLKDNSIDLVGWLRRNKSTSPVLAALLVFFLADQLRDSRRLEERLDGLEVTGTVRWLVWVFFWAQNGFGQTLPSWAHQNKVARAAFCGALELSVGGVIDSGFPQESTETQQPVVSSNLQDDGSLRLVLTGPGGHEFWIESTDPCRLMLLEVTKAIEKPDLSARALQVIASNAEQMGLHSVRWFRDVFRARARATSAHASCTIQNGTVMFDRSWAIEWVIAPEDSGLLSERLRGDHEVLAQVRSCRESWQRAVAEIAVGSNP